MSEESPSGPVQRIVSLHTPGPWIARQDPDAMLGDDWMIGRPSGKPDEVAVCSKRDAALIAAAPELLAACREAAAHVRPTCSELYARLMAALEKATGVPANTGNEPRRLDWLAMCSTRSGEG